MWGFLVHCCILIGSWVVVVVVVFSLPKTLYPNHVEQQHNPPPFNYSDPALHYVTHFSPRILDNYTPRQRYR